MKHGATRPYAGWLLAAVWLAVAACSSKNKPEKPAELVDFKQTLRVERAWSVGVGGEPKLRLGLGTAVDQERVYIAAPKGAVEAVQLANGKSLWRKSVKAELAGGPGAGGGLVVVGSANGEVIALATADGAERWRAQVRAEVLAAPAIGSGIVVVRTVDGKLHGLAAADGKQVWETDQQLPRLTLRGNAPPLISGDLVLAGFDNGRLMAVNLQNGSTVWDTAVGQARGSTEIQRLIDVDATVVVDGDDLFVVAFQGRVARIARETGQILWARDLSSYRGLAIDAESVYVSTSDGDVVRLDRRGGAEEWRQKALARRMLSAPVVQQGHVVVADLEGVVHWLKSADGSFEARAEVGGRVSAAPQVIDGLLLVFNDDGELRSFRLPAR
jgi:outer membrane protein assembly factor BamB